MTMTGCVKYSFHLFNIRCNTPLRLYIFASNNVLITDGSFLARGKSRNYYFGSDVLVQYLSQLSRNGFNNVKLETIEHARRFMCWHLPVRGP